MKASINSFRILNSPNDNKVSFKEAFKKLCVQPKSKPETKRSSKSKGKVNKKEIRSGTGLSIYASDKQLKTVTTLPGSFVQSCRQLKPSTSPSPRLMQKTTELMQSKCGRYFAQTEASPRQDVFTAKRQSEPYTRSPNFSFKP